MAALIASDAEVNAVFTGNHSETPLHWAASCDDVAVLDVLLDHGANIEAPGGVIGGGTPLADAVAFGQWQAALGSSSAGQSQIAFGQRLPAVIGDDARECNKLLRFSKVIPALGDRPGDRRITRS